jgi:hypothetical protein
LATGKSNKEGDTMPGTRARSLVVGLAAVIAVLGVGVPVGASDNCVDDHWCFVPVSTSDGSPLVRSEGVDDYWRDVATSPAAQQTVDGPLIVAGAGLTRSAFDWGDFGIGIGASVLVLGVGAGALGFRLSRGRTTAEGCLTRAMTARSTAIVICCDG